LPYPARIAKEVKSMPGVYQLSVDKIVEEARKSTISASQIILAFLKIKIQATGAWYDCGIVQKLPLL